MEWPVSHLNPPNLDDIIPHRHAQKPIEFTSSLTGVPGALSTR